MILSYLELWAFWCPKSNLSFKMWFFGLNSIRIISCDHKIHFGQKNFLKNALGRVYETFNFGSFGHFLLFSCLKVGWIIQQNNEKIEPSRFIAAFLRILYLYSRKMNFWWLFGYPEAPWYPKNNMCCVLGAFVTALNKSQKSWFWAIWGFEHSGAKNRTCPSKCAFLA